MIRKILTHKIFLRKQFKNGLLHSWGRAQNIEPV